MRPDRAADKLNRMQRLFVHEYLKDLNASQAAIRAGYSAKTAGVIGFNLLKLVKIQEAIDEVRGDREAAADITVERVLKELGKIGFSDIRKAIKWKGLPVPIGEDEDGVPMFRTFNEVGLIDSDKLDDATAAAISEISQAKDGSLKIKFHNKTQALDLIGKHLGMYKEKVELSGPNGSALAPSEIKVELVQVIKKPDE